MENHTARIYVKFGKVSLKDIDEESYAAVKDSLINCPDDATRAERLLMMQILAPAVAPDRYENDKKDPSILKMALVPFSPTTIDHDFDESDLKISASCGKLRRLLYRGNIIADEIIGVDKNSEIRGFFVEIWNNNLDTIDGDTVKSYMNQIIKNVEKYPNNVKIVLKQGV